MAPTVTVILPFRNGESYIHLALQSIVQQTFSNFKLIAIDDGSTDSSLEITKKYAATDSRIKVITRSQSGIVRALNEGICISEGKYIARMDADDISHPDRLSTQIAFLDIYDEVIACGTDVFFTDPEGRRLVRHFPKTNHHQIVDQLLEGNGGAIIHPTLMVRREALIEIGGYREEYQWIEDLDLYFRLSEVGELANLPEPLLDYRQHMKSVNRTKGNRESKQQSIVNPYRAKSGLAPLKNNICKSWGPDTSLKSDWRRHWAYEAARGGNWNAARTNAFKAFCLNPLKRDNLKCLKYVLSHKQ